ncbi:MAG: hypothetical protein ACOYNY_00585 [Caldilineaceae bacterium]|jgi:hypothetical protein
MTLTLEKQQVLSQIQHLLKELTPLEKLFLSEQLTADVRSQLFQGQITQEEQQKRVRLSDFTGVGQINEQKVHIYSPRLVHPEQAKYFEPEVVELTDDASL